ARAAGAGSPASAYRQLSATAPELYYRVRFKAATQSATAVNLLRFRTATGAAILTAFVSQTGKLAYRNDVSAVTTTSTTSVGTTWHELQVHALVTDASSRVDVWLDGLAVPDLSKPESLGPTPIGRIELGETATGRTFDVAFDDVLVDSSP